MKGSDLSNKVGKMFILTDIFYLRFTGFKKSLWFFKPNISEINSKQPERNVCQYDLYIFFSHLSFNGEFPYICESWYLLCPNITKTSLILNHLYSLFFNVFRFFQFLFQRVQTCSNMFWFWRCLSVRRHSGVVSCSNIGIWYSKKNITKIRLYVVLSHMRCLKKRGDFFFQIIMLPCPFSYTYILHN